MLTSLTNRVNTLLLVLIALMAAVIIAILANRANAGPLDPPGPPASTMHTLDDVYGSVQNVPQSWDKVLDSTNGAPGPVNPPAGCNSDRFKCVMTYAQCSGVCVNIYPAVLDEETGLVWQRTPSTGTADWAQARYNCSTANTGNRNGWRLPTLAEFLSLVSGASGSANIPSGNPFPSVAGSTSFWTSTEVLDLPNYAYIAYPYDSEIADAKTDVDHFWCVRGATSTK